MTINNLTLTASVTVFGSKNLVPNGELLNSASSWTLNTFNYSSTGGYNGGPSLTYTGTGGAVFYQLAESSPIDVVPGATYTISCWVNFSAAPSIQPQFVANTYPGNSYINGCFGTDGSTGFVSAIVTIPAGITQIRVLPTTGNQTIPSGAVLYWSQFQMEMGSTETSFATSLAGLTRTIKVPNTASLTSVGSFAKSAFAKFTASLTMSGTFAHILAIFQTLTGILNSSGSFTKSTGRSLTASLPANGGFKKLTNNALTAGLSVTGSFTKTVNGLLNAVLAMSGAVVGIFNFTRLLTAGLSFVGNVNRSTFRSLFASVLPFGSRNLIPNADLLNAAAGWVVGGLTYSSSGGPNGAASFSYVGTGTLATYQNAQSPPITVVPGNTYTLSCWANFSAAPAAEPQVVLDAYPSNAYISGAYGPNGTFGANGYTGYISATVVIPAGVTQLTVVPTTGLQTVPIGATVYWSQFQLENGSVENAYNGNNAGFSKLVTYPLLATSSFLGATFKNTARAFTATVSSTGFLSTVLTLMESFAAGLSLLGSMSKTPSRMLSGSLTSTGGVSRLSDIALNGTLSFVGSVAKALGRAATATLSFVGSINGISAFSRLLTAGVLLTGTVTKAPVLALNGVVSLSGLISRSAVSVLAAMLSFAGSIRKSSARTLPNANLTSTGSLGRKTSRAVSAALSLIGVAAKQTAMGFSGVLSFIGTIAKSANLLLSAVESFAGSVTFNNGVLYMMLSASLSFAGGITRSTASALSAALNLSGFIARKTVTVLSASLATTGNIVRSLGYNLTAALTFVGSILTGIGVPYFLSGTLTFVGAVYKAPNKSLNAMLGLSGVIARRMIYALLQATSILAGNINRRVTRKLPGSQLSFSGQVFKGLGRVLQGLISFIGSVTGIRYLPSTTPSTLHVTLPISTTLYLSLPIIDL